MVINSNYTDADIKSLEEKAISLYKSLYFVDHVPPKGFHLGLVLGVWTVTLGVAMTFWGLPDNCLYMTDKMLWWVVFGFILFFWALHAAYIGIFDNAVQFCTTRQRGFHFLQEMLISSSLLGVFLYYMVYAQTLNLLYLLGVGFHFILLYLLFVSTYLRHEVDHCPYGERHLTSPDPKCMTVETTYNVLCCMLMMFYISLLGMIVTLMYFNTDMATNVERGRSTALGCYNITTG